MVPRESNAKEVASNLCATFHAQTRNSLSHRSYPSYRIKLLPEAQCTGDGAVQRARWFAGRRCVGVKVAVACVLPCGHDKATTHVWTRTRASIFEAKCEASVPTVLFRDALDTLL